MRKSIQFASTVILAGLNGLAQQPIPTYSFRPVVPPGTTIADHSFTDDTVIENIVLNSSGEVGFVARWTDSDDNRSAVYTSHRLVARDGETIGGKTLTAIVGSIAINSTGRVAYEAEWNDPAAATARGVFLERDLVFAIDPSATGTGPDFILTDDGKIIPRPGVRLASPPTAAPASEPAKKKGIGLGNLGLRLPDSIAKRVPLTIKPNGTKPDQQTPSPTPPQQKPPAQPAPPAFSKPIGPCTMPVFPMPEEWQIGSETEGPAASHGFEPEVSGRKYFSQLYGPLNAPFRIVHFNRACKPLLIAIGDINTKGRLEVWAPSGLVTLQRPDGSYVFNGFPGTVKSTSFLKADSTIPINRRGQIVLYVTLSPQGHALLLGTPSH
jgi:hypothetical protein